MVESELKTGIETLKNNSGPTFGEGTVEVYINESYQHKETHQQPIYIWYEDGSWDDSEEEFNVTVQTTDITVTRTIEVDP